MSDLGICEYCKHKDKYITEKPCLHCSANMGAFEFDLSEHDAKIRAEVIEECIQAIEDTKSLFDNSTKWTMAEKNRLINALKRLKEKNSN